MEDEPIIPPPGNSPVSQDAALDLIIKSGRGPRWVKATITFLATAITSASGGMSAFVVGAVAGGVASAASLLGDKKQDEHNQLYAACIKEMAATLADLKVTIAKIVLSVDAGDDQFADRIESPQYQELIRRAFSGWSRGQSEEKREMIRRLLSHAASLPDPDYPLFSLFFDWIGRFNELHFRLIRSLKEQGNPTRLEIWQGMGGARVRDDSAEADVFGALVKDLTFNHIIRQWTRKAADGRRLKKTRNASRQPNPYMKSIIDDKEPYELTAVGELFIHHAMEELLPKLPGDRPSP